MLFSGGSCFSFRDSSVNCDRDIAFALVRGKGFAGFALVARGMAEREDMPFPFCD